MSTSIVWFRNCLRVDDHPALHAAALDGRPVICVYLAEQDGDATWTAGAATRWWLHHSLDKHHESLVKLGSKLIIRCSADASETLAAIADECGAVNIHAIRCHAPASLKRDAQVTERLEANGCQVHWHAANLLFDPTAHTTSTGTPYRVYTPFSRACLARESEISTVPAPTSLPAPDQWPASDVIASLGLLPKVDWASGFRTTWTPGESGAQAMVARFLDGASDHYDTERDRPDREGTSRLSPHLHFGEISPRRIWQQVRCARQSSRGKGGSESFLRQLIWREFAHQLLFHYPETTDEPMRPAFADFPWEDDAQALRAWQRGRTGYPIVDAGMRQLWHTGWMHNRVRMVVGSLLTKHLLIGWQHGARWFWDTLVDADLANNTLGWQWIAGCGADAAPYFRIFNPVLQGERFDPEGDYVRTWVPELKAMPARWIHQPWQAPSAVLTDAGVQLGATYPEPIVDHATGRARALAAYQRMKQTV